MSELDNLNEGGTGGGRPTFLTVLCILTFIGSGWGIVSNLMTLASGGMVEETTAMMEQTMDEAMDEIGDEPGASFFESMMSSGMAAIEHMKTLAIVGIIACLLTLAGAIMMWKLQKKGFYIYTLGELGAPIASAVIVGGAFGGMMLVGLLIPIIFVILYALNLKHMH